MLSDPKVVIQKMLYIWINQRYLKDHILFKEVINRCIWVWALILAKGRAQQLFKHNRIKITNVMSVFLETIVLPSCLASLTLRLINKILSQLVNVSWQTIPYPKALQASSKTSKWANRWWDKYLQMVAKLLPN